MHYWGKWCLIRCRIILHIFLCTFSLMLHFFLCTFVAITDLSSKYGYTFNETTERLHQKYGGYYFGKSNTEVYNPYSTLNAFSQLRLNDFWIGAFDPKGLMKRLIKNQEQIDHFAGKYYNSFEFCNLSAIIPSTLPLLYQYGCLTIRSYDMEHYFWKLKEK